MSKQTAMQIMLNELLSHGYKIPFHLVEKCKELLAMEKEQIVKAFEVGYNQNYEQQYNTIEQYYNETYGDKH